VRRRSSASSPAGRSVRRSTASSKPVANAQAVEHYEMFYGTLRWAEELGPNEIARFLTTNLNEEKTANTKLNTAAQRKGFDRPLRPISSPWRLR